MPGVTAAKVAFIRLNFGNRKHELTRRQAHSADTRVHGAALSSGPSCRQDGDRYFERLQPAAKKLHVFVAVAATTAFGCCCFEGISYVICADGL
jgi:hypothetical protein